MELNKEEGYGSITMNFVADYPPPEADGCTGRPRENH